MNQHQEDNDNATTAYQQQLHPWCLIQHLPRMRSREVARFRRRNDADAHLRALRQLAPAAQYIIVFDPTSEKLNAKTDEELFVEKAIAP